MLLVFLLVALTGLARSLRPAHPAHRSALVHRCSPRQPLKSLLDPSHIDTLHTLLSPFVHSWDSYSLTLAADASSTAASASPAAASPEVWTDGVLVCPAFGQPGWGPLCGLQLQNPLTPLFKGFDAYQSFIQNTIVSLHDFYKEKLGIDNTFGMSIVSFTVLIRLLILPLTFKTLGTSAKSQLLAPKIAEIKLKFEDKEMQNQLIGRLYQDTETNPLAGCLPALIQIPVFLGLYRSFLNLASSNQMAESFLWIPNLQGPVFGERSTDWLFKVP